MQFTHLHVHTQYSLLDGAAKISDLVNYAKEQGMQSLAITDHGVMYGVVDFYQACEKAGIRPVIGCEIYNVNGDMHSKQSKERFHLVLLAENTTGYHNLMRIVSLSHTEGFYMKPRADKETLRKYHEGIICLSACLVGELPRLLLVGNWDGAKKCVQEFIDIFGRENYFLEMQNHYLPEDKIINAGLRKLAAEFGLGLVCTNDSHYVRRSDAAAQDVLLAIQTGTTVDDPDRMRFPNDEFYLKSPAEMAELFPEDGEALANTNRIAERCHVQLQFGKSLLPEFKDATGKVADACKMLRELCEAALPERYPHGDAKVRQRLEYELDVIHKMGYDAYFLIVWDFIDYARKQGIPVGPGRGSAAGSIVAYLLHITNIEPLHFNLFFERFLNPQRVSMPDIDTDFCMLRRDEVLRYVVQKYGADQVAQIVTFGSLQARAAVRAVGRALAMPYADVDSVVKAIPRKLAVEEGDKGKSFLQLVLEKVRDVQERYENEDQVRRLIDLALSVEGLPNNRGTHAAGVIIAPSTLTDFVPLQLEVGQNEFVATSQTYVTQYDKNFVEQLGLLKMDFLGLRTLTAIYEAMAMIQRTTGKKIDIDNIPWRDAATAKMLCAGDTFGVFQLESDGITKLLVDLAPEGFEDLVPLVALYRPGPLGSGMANDFINRRRGRAKVEYLHPLMEPILRETYGVIVYQEQVMQIGQALAGFSLGQADEMRRAMGKKKKKVLDEMRQQFISGGRQLHNIPEALGGKVFDLLYSFADYGFNKSHSVAYAFVAYQTAYLKANYCAQFMAALLNSFEGDGEQLTYYIAKLRAMPDMKIKAPDINVSEKTFTALDSHTVHCGLMGIKSLGDGAIDAILTARQKGGRFKDLADFCKRVNSHQITRRVIENLIRCGAMDSFGAKRSQLLAVLDKAVEIGQAVAADNETNQLNLFGEDSGVYFQETLELPDVPELPKALCLADEKELVGFYVNGHPLDEYASVLKRYDVITALSNENKYQDGSNVKIGGIITSCQLKNTRLGDTMANLVIEDLSGGEVKVVVFPKTYKQGINYIYPDATVEVIGRLDLDERGLQIIAGRVDRLQEPVHQLHLKITAEQETAECRQELMEILQQFSGQDEVFLHLADKGQVIKCAREYRVSAVDLVLQQKLEALLGPHTLFVK